MPLAVLALAIMPVASLPSTPVADSVVAPVSAPVVPGAPPPVVDAAPIDSLPAAVPAPDAVAVPDAATAAADDGDIMVVGHRSDPGDPAQAINIVAFNATQAVDRAVIGPVALTFERVVPSPIRSGLRNFLNNLHEPNNAINFLLQHKIGKFVETVARFVLNSTVGVGGLIDVARRRPFNLPRRRNSFANTFGFYGIGPGPFLFLPLVGATSLRDLIGGSLDSLAGPAAAGAPFNRSYYAIPTGALRELDNRAEFDATLTHIRNDSVDPYTAARTEYLTRRRGEIDMLRCGRIDCAVSAAVAAVVPSPVTPSPAEIATAASLSPAAAASVAVPVDMPLTGG